MTKEGRPEGGGKRKKPKKLVKGLGESSKK